MNFVTKNRTRLRGVNKRGRPRKYTDQAAKQKAYRQRKGSAVPFGEGTRVHHEKHGAGVIIRMLSQERAYVAYPERVWRDLPTSELTPAGIAKKIPVWADPTIPNPKKRVQMVPLSAFPGDKSLVLASFPDVSIKDIPVYTKNVAGKSRTFKDFSGVINDRIARLIWRAKGKL